MTRQQPRETPCLFYRLGVAADRRVLQGHPDAYSGVVINAQIAIWGKNWIGTFLGSSEKPYFVDPVTHLLALDPDLMLRKENLRKSFEKLLPHYGTLASKFGGERSFRSEDLWDGSRLTTDGEELSESVITFQKEVFRKEKRMQQSLLRYMKILDEKLPVAEPSEPLLLIPPYFYAESPDDDWYRVSLNLAHFSSEAFSDEAIWPAICVSSACLDSPRALRRILEDYSDFEGVLVWISAFDETKESFKRLRSLKLLLDGFSESDTPWISLYGGYFALCLTRAQRSGIVSGISYGESKDVNARTTGGGFPPRYYVPVSRTMAVSATARTFLTDHPAFLCNCDVCNSVLERIGAGKLGPEVIDRFLTEFDPGPAKQHFLLNRAMEAETVHECSRQEVIDSLRQDYERLEKIQSGLYEVENAHLGRWARALTS